jgi:hypothetical protein
MFSEHSGREDTASNGCESRKLSRKELPCKEQVGEEMLFLTKKALCIMDNAQKNKF